MRALRSLLVGIGLAFLALAAGFFFQTAWARGLWPLPDGRLSYSFMAAILAGSAMPLIWVGLAGEVGALAGYGLGFGVMFGGMGLYAFQLYVVSNQPPLMRFALVSLSLALLCWVMFIWSRDQAITDPRPTPRWVRLAFVAEVAVLAGVGSALVLKIPNVLPWPLEPESSVMYGWVFLGQALYYAYALLNPEWHNARGQLLGFLAYDLVLIGPLLGRFANLQPEQWLGQVTALVIILGSGALGVYYLMVNTITRGWALPGVAGSAQELTGEPKA